MCSLKTMYKLGNTSTLNRRSYNRGRKSKAVLFLRRADESRYGQLIEDLMKADFLGRYEYPEMMNGAYELFVRTSRQFNGSNLRGGSQNFGNRCGHGGRTSVMFTKNKMRPR